MNFYGNIGKTMLSLVCNDNLLTSLTSLLSTNFFLYLISHTHWEDHCPELPIVQTSICLQNTFSFNLKITLYLLLYHSFQIGKSADKVISVILYLSAYVFETTNKHDTFVPTFHVGLLSLFSDHFFMTSVYFI